MATASFPSIRQVARQRAIRADRYCQSQRANTNVASGDGDAIEKLRAHFTAQGRRAKRLKVSHAFHSHRIDGMLADFQAMTETVRFHPPTLPIVSGLTGQLATPGQPDDGIQTLTDRGMNIALELGPQPLLCGMGAVCLAGNGITDNDINTIAWLPSVVAKKDAASVIQDSRAELYIRDVSVDWIGFFKRFGCQCVELPTYAFQQERIRLDAKPGP
ncbi:acyl transferase/acyl hydrolase/lysophospholipase [Xylariaceae sp. FL1651]|nr:acyl transferase/acyl hydrolase/lysophospholipase [Xylariaceae sp. FL1651]